MEDKSKSPAHRLPSIEFTTVNGHNSKFGWTGDKVPTMNGLKYALQQRDDRIKKIESELENIKTILRKH